MPCSKETVIHCVDSIILVIIFLFQSVVLNYLVINQFIQSSFTFLWFLGDFLCLLVFAFTLYISYRIRWKDRHGSLKSSINTSHSRNSSRNGRRSVSPETSWPRGLNCFSRISKSPFCYIAWIFYSCTLIAKIIVLFKAKNPPGALKEDDFFGPQMVKIGISLSAIIFSLLVEAHHDAHDDPVRNAYIKTISCGMALEILDSVSFLSLLIVKETHLLYTFAFENFILGLSSINIMLPAVALYKLTISGFGETYSLPLEIIYKLLHLFLVNIPYLSVRIYLWQFYSYSDTSIFMVKNIYAIIALLRAIYPDLIRAVNCYKNRNITSIVHRPGLPTSNGILQNETNSVNVRKKNNMEEVTVALTTLKKRQDDRDESDILRQFPPNLKLSK